MCSQAALDVVSYNATSDVAILVMCNVNVSEQDMIWMSICNGIITNKIARSTKKKYDKIPVEM